MESDVPILVEELKSKELGKVTSSTGVDPSQLLLRLAGKPTTKNNGDDRNNRCLNKKKNKKTNRKSSVKVPHAEIKVPTEKVSETNGPVEEASHEAEWNDVHELDETTLASFRELFNMLDQSNRGIITADNLFEELRRLDSEITYSEVEDVLRKVDKDGNGEIDFDEFIHHMTTMGGELFGDDGGPVDEEHKKKYSRRQHLFYSAITQYSIKQIEKSIQKQVPHVISHYTAGVRLIGLTARQLERQMKKMQKSAANNDSPYAKPLQFVCMGSKRNIKGQKKLGDCHSQIQMESAPPELDTVADLSQELKDTMKFFAQQRGTIVTKLPDANILLKLKEKIGNVTAKIKKCDLGVSETPNSLAPVTLLKPKSVISTRFLEEDQKLRASQRRKSGPKNKNRRSGMGWTTQRIQYIEVPLPRIRMKLNSEKPTFNDLHRIRAKANEAIDEYYHDLRQTEIRNAWDHWDRLYADVILPKKLLENFRTVYSAYSPHREEEAFVVCPWKPGPFSFIRLNNKGPVCTLPNFKCVTRRVQPFINRRKDLHVRPISSMSKFSQT